jgi:hypothetical protein
VPPATQPLAVGDRLIVALRTEEVVAIYRESIP